MNIEQRQERGEESKNSCTHPPLLAITDPALPCGDEPHTGVRINGTWYVPAGLRSRVLERLWEQLAPTDFRP